MVGCGFPQRLKSAIHHRLTARLKAAPFQNTLNRTLNFATIFNSPSYRVTPEFSFKAETFGSSYSVAFGWP